MTTPTNSDETIKRVLTRYQKGKRWATGTLVICGLFSIWANVRSGQMNAESVIVSILPPIVAFATSHLISYFNPTKVAHKLLSYGGFGIVCIVAMYGSGWHIYDYVVATGQHWTTGIAYIFITDAPMLLAAAILSQKVPTTQTSANRTNTAKATTKPNPTKAVKGASATKRTTATKKANPPKTPDIMMDPFERDMLTA